MRWRCNGCKLAKLRHTLGDKFLMIPGQGVYELDAQPSPGQGEPQSYEGRPIRFHWWGMSYGHSDECYHWQPQGGGLTGEHKPQPAGEQKEVGDDQD